MVNERKDYNNLVEASISVLESKKLSYKKSFCIACGLEFRAILIPICSDCLDSECDIYVDRIDGDETK